MRSSEDVFNDGSRRPSILRRISRPVKAFSPHHQQQSRGRSDEAGNGPVSRRVGAAMSFLGEVSRSAQSRIGAPCRIVAASLTILAVTASGCRTQSLRVAPSAIHLIQSGRYDEARAQLRRPSLDRESPEIILDNLRLAVAALHDGAFFEAEQALLRAYPYMVTGTVNAPDRQDAAVFGFESRLIWKGEPFEQAMAWYYQALLQMIKGDWENARAMARNMLFTLADFAGAASIDEAMREAEDPEWFDAHADEVESDLVLGYLLAGIAEHWQNRPAEAREMFDRAVELRSELAELVSVLRTGEYNTLILVETEPGPSKQPRGAYGELFVYEPASRTRSEKLIVTRPDGRSLAVPETFDVIDTWALARHPRWWSLRSLRETKRIVGDVLTAGGAAALVIGASADDSSTRDKAVLAGLGMILAGQMMAASSAADLRHFDVGPRTVHLLPLNLDPGPTTIRFSLPRRGLEAVRHFIMPGNQTPAVYTVRLLPVADRISDVNEWAFAQIAREILHPNDVTGPIVGTYPYVLGGTCTCTPTQEVLETYQAGGYLLGLTLQGLLDIYTAEGIVFAPLPARRETTDTYHHILRGGRLLYTPVPGSDGFEQLTYGEALPYRQQSQLVREISAEIRGESAR